MAIVLTEAIAACGGNAVESFDAALPGDAAPAADARATDAGAGEDARSGDALPRDVATRTVTASGAVHRVLESGVVIEPMQFSAEGMTLWVEDGNGGFRSFLGSLDGAGRLRFDGVPEGRYTIVDNQDRVFFSGYSGSGGLITGTTPFVVRIVAWIGGTADKPFRFSQTSAGMAVLSEMMRP